MRTETRTQDWFLRKPECRKWIRQCVTCGSFGRDPKRPANTLSYAFDDMFPPMMIDDLGRCEQCHEAAQSIDLAHGNKA